jgi:hypothetical protein
MTPFDILRSRPAPVANYRHTVILGAALVALGLAGFALHDHGSPGLPGGGLKLLEVYLPVLLLEFLLLRTVWVAVKRHEGSGWGLISQRPLTPALIARDVALGLAVFALFAGISLASRPSAPAMSSAARLVRQLAAHTPLEAAVWVVLACVAAVAEEVAFRGYLQRQISAWSGYPLLGLVAQAAIFAWVHSYQGSAALPGIFLLGLVFGSLTLFSRSLAPAIICHAAIDLVSGLTSG